MTDQLHTEGGTPSMKERPVLLITTVNIEKAQPAIISVRKGDDTSAVARDFVLSHGLPAHIIPELSKHLCDNLQAHLEQQAQLTVGKGNAVFDRLYQQAVDLRGKLDEQRDWVREYEMELFKACKPRMTWISMAMMRDRGAGPFNNYGEMLYAESLHKMQLKQEKIQKLREELEADEVLQMTFKPQLSPRSRQLWSTTHAANETPAWARLNDVYKSVKDRIEKQRQEKEKQEEHACTFQPVISSKSQKLAQQAVPRYAVATTTVQKAASNTVPNHKHTQVAESTTGADSDGPSSPKKLTAKERLYGDAMRRMQRLQTITEAGSPNSLLRSITTSGKASPAGSPSAQLDQGAFRGTAGAARASTAGQLLSLGSHTAARAAARAATSIAGSIDKKRASVARASTAGHLLSFGGHTAARAAARSVTTTAGGISDKRASQTLGGTARITVAGGSKQSQAGALGFDGARSSYKTQAWH